jgi:hypothetical protein
MNRDRAVALGVLCIAFASGSLMIAGGEQWQRQLGWALWPLLIVLPVVYGRVRQRRSA